MKKLYNRIFNLKFILIVIATGFFACILKLFFLEILQLPLSLDKLDLNNLSFYTIIILFKSVLSIILEEYLSYGLHDGVNGFKTSNTLSMEEKGSVNKNSGTGSSESVNTSAMENMSENFHSTLKDMLQYAHGLNIIKVKNNISYLVDNSGGLQMDVPLSMSDKDVEVLSSKVSDLDSKYIASSDRYNRLLELDKRLYNGVMADDFKKSHQNAKTAYDNLFK